jgi:hypothetical protein
MLARREKTIVKRLKSVVGVFFTFSFSLLTLAGLAGCGGSNTNNTYITGITVSPSATVLAGTEVTVTATVQDDDLFQSARWTADGGTLSVSTGLTTRWVAPRVQVPADFTLTLLVRQTSGLSDLETVRIHVEPPTSSAFITGVTVSPSGTVRSGGEVVLTATVRDAAQIRSIQWLADQGTLVTRSGLTARWIAPIVAASTDVNVNLVVDQTNGLTDTATVTLRVNP